MAHGQPDFGMYTLAKTIYRMTDMGELAVRLDSIVSHDRRGDVIHVDDFSGGLGGWYASGLGAGYGIALSSDVALKGVCSLKVTTGDSKDDYGVANHLYVYPVASRLGFEWIVALGDNDGDRYFLASPDDDVYISSASIYYLAATGVWQVDDNGTPTNLGTKALYDNYRLFHHVKLVVDMTTGKYVRLIVDNVEFDLSAYTMLTAAASVSAHIGISYYVFTDADANKSDYLGGFIITQNEP